jgi:ribosome biogenesis GTPase / thiamine phosphate phosphatase
MMELHGLVVRAQSGFFTVQTEQGVFVCRLRGRLKRGPRTGDLAALGDRVVVTLIDGETGMIEEVLPRQRALSRMAPTPRGEYEQIIVANPDQAVLVFACEDPAPRLGMLDRFLVIAEKHGIPAAIIANKIDLVDQDEAEALFGHYPGLGYPVIYASAHSGAGVREIHELLAGKLSVLVGPSGVGKSSLLNAMQPGLGLAVNEVSEATGKGRHTTVVRQLFPLESGGYVADTPGLKALALWDVETTELDGYFPELRERVMACAYNDCAHIDEPGCAVIEALECGEIHPRRYQSYLSMRTGAEEQESFTNYS